MVQIQDGIWLRIDAGAGVRVHIVFISVYFQLLQLSGEHMPPYAGA